MDILRWTPLSFTRPFQNQLYGQILFWNLQAHGSYLAHPAIFSEWSHWIIEVLLAKVPLHPLTLDVWVTGCKKKIKHKFLTKFGGKLETADCVAPLHWQISKRSAEKLTNPADYRLVLCQPLSLQACFQGLSKHISFAKKKSQTMVPP